MMCIISFYRNCTMFHNTFKTKKHPIYFVHDAIDFHFNLMRFSGTKRLFLHSKADWFETPFASIL